MRPSILCRVLGSDSIIDVLVVLTMIFPIIYRYGFPDHRSTMSSGTSTMNLLHKRQFGHKRSPGWPGHGFKRIHGNNLGMRSTHGSRTLTPICYEPGCEPKTSATQGNCGMHKLNRQLRQLRGIHKPVCELATVATAAYTNLILWPINICVS